MVISYICIGYAYSHRVVSYIRNAWHINWDLQHSHYGYVSVKSKLQHPPRANPRAFDFFENYCSNFPLPGGCWSFDLTDTLAITKHWSIFITPQLFVDVTIWLSQSVSSYIGVLICWFNNSQTQWFLIQFSLVTYLQHLDCIIITTRNKVTNKRKKKKKKLMALIEVYGGQRSLAFELHHRDIMNRNT